ncbi:MAG: hypothetical protein ETSY1_19715 [Candidatus Entotheonella factor]|uniref:C4-dicarboxylate ABC transporter substrate-binding protein n=1 Tax=Entotheonella factor TaxID=1429438 RepID=W4LKF9_ENTF1|nr:hypothetical protein [Candidatus Entotheonella palauensis]ETW98195.1 MAG: hypothetical protein ETSY1_19715 [Candidatus Entotheonella factor]
MGHTPFQQWVVYRKRHLIILTGKTDGSAYELGKRVAAVLANELPASQARVTRAPYMERIGSLLSTDQLDVALLSGPAAVALLHGLPPFTDYGPLALRRIVALGAYLLVCRDDFPARHAYLVAQALDEHLAELAANASAPSEAGNDTGTVPMHPGALAYIEGQPIPELTSPKP